jgi:hypothetical protein
MKRKRYCIQYRKSQRSLVTNYAYTIEYSLFVKFEVFTAVTSLVLS